MDKNELLYVILRDIKELELLANGMLEMEKVPSVMQNLATAKTQNILDAINSLNISNVSATAEKQFDKVKSVCEKFQQIPEVKSIEPISTYVKPMPIEERVEEKTEEKIDVINVEIGGKSAEKFVPIIAEDNDKIKNEKKAVIEENIQSEIVEKREEKEELKIDKTSVNHTKHTTNDKFNTGAKSVNDSLPQSGKSFEGKFIKSIRKSLNLNDTFRYKRTLFGGNQVLMTTTIDALDAMSSFSEAKQYIKDNFAWNSEDENAEDFFKLVEARFSK